MSRPATVTVEIAGQKSVATERKFSSGSDGYFLGDKVVFDNGDRYQVSCSIVRIGSKPKPMTKAAK